MGKKKGREVRMPDDKTQHRLKEITGEIVALCVKTHLVRGSATHRRISRDIESARESLRNYLQIGELVLEWQTLRQDAGLRYGLDVLACDVDRTSSYLSQFARFAQAEQTTIDQCVEEGLNWRGVLKRIGKDSRKQVAADLDADPTQV